MPVLHAQPRHALERASSAIVLLLTVGACSGGDKIVDPNAVTSSSNGSLIRADSLYLVNLISAAASQSIKGLRQVVTPDLPLLGANAPTCTPSATTGGTDTNGNGIPDDRTLQYTSSCAFVSAGRATTVTGSVRTQDLGEVYAFRVSYTNVVISATKGDSVVSSTLNGTFEYRWTSATSANALDATTLQTSVRSANGSQSLTRVANLRTQFTPSSGSTIATGRALPAGSMSLSGTLSVSALATGTGVVVGSPSSATLNVSVATAIDMTMSASCTAEPVFNLGTINGAVSGSATGAVSVKFVGCGGVPSKA